MFADHVRTQHAEALRSQLLERIEQAADDEQEADEMISIVLKYVGSFPIVQDWYTCRSDGEDPQVCIKDLPYDARQSVSPNQMNRCILDHKSKRAWHQEYREAWHLIDETLYPWLQKQTDDPELLIDMFEWLCRRPDICRICGCTNSTDGEPWTSYIQTYQYPSWWPFADLLTITPENIEEKIHRNTLPGMVYFQRSLLSSNTKLGKLAVIFEGRLQVGAVQVDDHRQFAVNEGIETLGSLKLYPTDGPERVVEISPRDENLIQIAEALTDGTCQAGSVVSRPNTFAEMSYDFPVQNEETAADASPDRRTTMVEVVEWQEPNRLQEHLEQNGRKKHNHEAELWQQFRDVANTPIRKPEGWNTLIDAVESLLGHILPNQANRSPHSYHHRKRRYEKFLKQSRKILLPAPAGKPFRQILKIMEGQATTMEKRVRVGLISSLWAAPIDLQASANSCVSWPTLALYSTGDLDKRDMKVASSLALMIEGIRQPTIVGCTEEEWLERLRLLSLGASKPNSLSSEYNPPPDLIYKRLYEQRPGLDNSSLYPAYARLVREVLLNADRHESGPKAQQREFGLLDDSRYEFPTRNSWA